VRVHGRVRLPPWSVLPFPWPKGAVPQAVRTRLTRLAAAWPADAPRPHLVADRLFASQALLEQLGTLLDGLKVGAEVVFVNDDPSGSPHTASGLGVSGFPATFANTSATTRSGTAIDSGLTWSTGTLSAGQQSQTFTIPAAGTYYFGCAFHYASNTMRDVLVAS